VQKPKEWKRRVVVDFGMNYLMKLMYNTYETTNRRGNGRTIFISVTL